MTKPSWLRTGWATHQGRRPRNEDAVLVTGALLAVADGVGGAPRGDLASLEAVDTVRETLAEPPLEPDLPEVASELADALSLADEAVKGLAEQWGQLRGTATTMCAGYIFADSATNSAKAVIANVGDSRCYQVRDGVAYQITVDQTLAVDLKRAGIDDVHDRAHNIVTSVLGGHANDVPSVDLFNLGLQVGDTILFCTDGITGVVSPDKLAEVCTTYRLQPNMVAAALVRLAWDNGSTDNITAAVAEIGA